MKLFIGNLPYGFTDEDVSDLFQEIGEVVSAKVIVDRDSGRSRGFGFVEMSDQSAAGQAIETLDGSTVGGRTIVVKKAHDRR